ncbi:MAG: hypothetical protein ABIW82_14300 [Dokdonella sp.]
MSRFLRFLLTAYAPLAARHMLVDGLSFRPAAASPSRTPRPRVAEFSTCIDIGGRLWRASGLGEDLTSLAV